MADQIVRAITADGFLKISAIEATALTETARRMHHTTPVATAALGRALCACSIIGNLQKVEDGSVTLKLQGDGPLGTILAVSDATGNVRGWVENPEIALLEKYRGKLDVGAAVGTDGTLTLIRDLRMKEPYIGTVALLSGEIAEDVANYFVTSEQIPTACALGVLVDRDESVLAAGGYLLQLMPGAPEALISQVERGVAAAGPVSQLLAEGATAHSLIKTVLRGMELEFLETVPVSYRCYCSRSRVSDMLLSLGRAELRDIVSAGEDITVDCQFCDTIYRFTPAQVQEILNGAD